jgi:hypothetical protein
LREHHAQILVETGGVLDLVLAVIASHAAPEGRQRQVLHDLRENELALVHGRAPRWAPSWPANAAIRVQIETRQEHELSLAYQIVVTLLALNVGTALMASKLPSMSLAHSS